MQIFTVLILQDFQPTPTPPQPTTTPLSVVQYKIALEPKRFSKSLNPKLERLIPYQNAKIICFIQCPLRERHFTPTPTHPTTSPLGVTIRILPKPPYASIPTPLRTPLPITNIDNKVINNNLNILISPKPTIQYCHRPHLFWQKPEARS